MPKDDLITTVDVANALGVHVRTVHRMVSAGRLEPAVKVPGMRGAYLFHRADVDALLAGERVA